MGDSSAPERGYTLDDAFVAIGFGRFQVWVLAYAGLGYGSVAVQTMIVSFIGPSVKSEWNLSSAQENLLSSVIFAGVIAGAYSWGSISDLYGRRKGLLCVAVVASGAAFLTTFAPNYVWLVILRFLVGFGGSGGSVYMSWFLEFIPAPNRGTWMIIFTVFWTAGNVLEASLAWIIMPRLGWRWLLALSSIPSFATLLFYNLAPESPRYLCLSGREADAHEMLEHAAAINQTELPSGILLSDQMEDEKEVNSMEDPLLLSSKANATMDSKTGLSTLQMLFSSSLIRTTLLLWPLFFGINFGYYGIILLTSVLSSGQSGCSSVTLQPVNSQDSSYRDILVASVAELPGLVLSGFIIDRIGRKLSMTVMSMLTFVLILPLLFHQNEVLTTVLLSGSRMFITGTLSVGNVYALELYPTSVRATGVGLACAVGGIGSMICPLVAVGLLNDCHQTAAIVLFELVIVITGLCVLFFPHETKGQALSDHVDS